MLAETTELRQRGVRRNLLGEIILQAHSKRGRDKRGDEEYRYNSDSNRQLVAEQSAKKISCHSRVPE